MANPAADAPPPTPAPTLTDVPAALLSRLLSSPVPSMEDLGRLACVSRALRAAATAPALPQWSGVRVAGSTNDWWPDAETFAVRRLRRIAKPLDAAALYGGREPHAAAAGA